MFLYTGTAYSSILPSSSRRPMIQAKTKPINARSKSSVIKLASVTFISKGSLDYKMTESDNANCDAENYPYTSEMGLANCKTIEKCRNKNIIRARCASCKGNMTLTNHKCSCNTTYYKHDMYQNPCLYAYDQEDYCQEIGPDNVLKTFYANCTCPNNWNECNGTHQIGLGVPCNAKGKNYFYSCTCENEYSSNCQNSRPLNSTDYCININQSGARYYNGCYSCEVSQSANYSQSEWWNSLCSNVFGCGE